MHTRTHTSSVVDFCFVLFQVLFLFSVIFNLLFIYLLFIKEGNFYLTTHSTHFIYGYMASEFIYYLLLLLCGVVF